MTALVVPGREDELICFNPLHLPRKRLPPADHREAAGKRAGTGWGNATAATACAAARPPQPGETAKRSRPAKHLKQRAMLP